MNEWMKEWEHFEILTKVDNAVAYIHTLQTFGQVRIVTSFVGAMRPKLQS